ncbi:MAG: PQQ-binding-like beta-propeller repeat protein, partial [Planctomycetota bacterium]|nr:PQQ-binding-like beta-propeller repeat protein [Planctomycetota bacterium]
MTTFLLPVLLAASWSAAVDPTPSGQPWTLVPPEWKAPPIQWRATWEETFKTFDPSGQAITSNPALTQAGWQILAMQRVEFLKALCEHFPQEEAKRIEAYKEIAETLRRVSDVWGRNYWYARLAEDFPNRPDGRVWWDYAIKGIESLEPQKAPPNSAAWGAWINMCQLRCSDMIEEGRYEQCRRYVQAGAAHATAETALNWWQNQLADLYKAGGNPLQAAEVWEKAGNRAAAEACRAAAAAGSTRDFAQAPQLESRWEVLSGGSGVGVRKGVTDVEGFQTTLDLCQQSEAVPVGSATPFVPFRPLITHAIGAMPADRLDALRAAQEAACRTALREAANSGEGDEVVRLFRRYPWAGNVHEAMLAAAQRQLHAGGYPWACRAFSDVLEFSNDGALRRQAHVGLWLSLASQPDGRAAAERAMAAVPDEELLPWRGGQERAQAVKKAILAPDDSMGVAALSALPRRRIELPPAAAWADTPSGNAFLDSATIGSWAIGQIAQADGRVYLAGPSVAACYAPGAEKPLWWRHSTGQAGAPATPNQWGSFVPGRGIWLNPGLHPGRRTPALAGDSSPAVAADLAGERRTFFALVNDAPPPGPREALVAFDAASGLVRWSTAARDEWKGLRPLNRPAAAPGRVYALAVAAGTAAPNAPVSVQIFLTCLAADDGRTLWRRALGGVTTNSRLLTQAAGGWPVTLHGGWVYCSSDLGLAAKCDARDGAVEWVASYFSADQNARAAVQFRREGASPLPVGEKLILAPRDHSGLIALDAATGKLLWESTLIPSDRLAGRIGSTLLVRSLAELGGIELDTGRELWTLPIETPAPAQVCLRGGEAIVLAANTLRRITPAGAVAETLALTPPPGSEYALLADGSLLELASQPSPVPAAPEAPGPLALPLARTWSLPLARPILLAPPPEGPRDSFCTLSGRLVVRVRTQPAVGVVWQQSLATEPVAGVFAGENLLLSDGSNLTALDLATGAIRWQTPIGFCITSFDGDAQVAAAVESFSDANATVVDMASGKVLWHKIISEPMRFGDWPVQQVRIRREDGGRTIAFYWAGALYGSLGGRPSELTVEARTGALLSLRPCLGDETNWPRAIALGARGIHFLDSSGCPRTVGFDGATVFASKRPVDVGPLNWSQAAVGLLPTPAGLYAKSLGELVG